jgi:hypothetical protein
MNGFSHIFNGLSNDGRLLEKVRAIKKMKMKLMNGNGCK